MNPTLPHYRVEPLARALQEAGVDAYFAWSPITRTYLANFGEKAGERFLTLAVNTQGRSRLICPALSETQARRAGIQDLRPWRDGEDPLEHFRTLADEWGLRSAILAVDNEMPAAMLLAMQAALPAALFRTGHEVLSAVMRKKDAEELAKMRKAGEIADRALQAGLDAIRPGATELEVAEALSSAMRQLGGEPSFFIVATGPLGAEPHHESDNTHIEEGHVVVLDFGCNYEGYQSDITRTVACRRADEEAHRVYDIVLQAHQAARAAIRPGITAGEIDMTARRIIEQAGYGQYFTHRTGHGIGMHLHEAPYIMGGSDVVLEEGDCFSVEPGIYLPDQFGVRIENIVTVTAEGHASLNEEPAERLIEV